MLASQTLICWLLEFRMQMKKGNGVWKTEPQKTLQQHIPAHPQEAHFSSHIHTLYTHFFTVAIKLCKGSLYYIRDFC